LIADWIILVEDSYCWLDYVNVAMNLPGLQKKKRLMSSQYVWLLLASRGLYSVD